jgi:hypothetical protein
MHPHHQSFGHRGGGGSFHNQNWGWNPYDYYGYAQPDVVQTPVPTWVWVAGGALAGIIFVRLIGGR